MKCPKHHVNYELAKTSYEQYGVILKMSRPSDAQSTEKNSSQSNRQKQFAKGFLQLAPALNSDARSPGPPENHQYTSHLRSSGKQSSKWDKKSPST